MPAPPRIKSDVALGNHVSILQVDENNDDNSSFYSNNFSTLSLVNTSGVPAQRERGNSIRITAANAAD